MGGTSESVTSRIVAYHAAAVLLLTITTARPAASQHAHDQSSIPHNLVVPDIVRPLVTAMWRQSPTFRRQCARLSDNPHVTVSIELASKTRHGRARSRIDRANAGLHASVEIELRTPEMYVEYISHELEHVLEIVDGVDLPLFARRGLDGVFSGADQYETARARSVGEMVAHEVVLQ
jgi:hypothetical protein